MTEDRTAAPTKVSPRLYRLTARARGLSHRIGIPLLFGGLLISYVAPDLLPKAVLAAAVLVGVAGLMLATALGLMPIEATLRPRPIELPVLGRWIVLNSPASTVPSHGSNGYGQTYGFDLVFDPPGGGRPSSRGLGFDPPGRFPAFGQPVLAPVGGVVVDTRSYLRDHRCRARWPAFAVLYLEGFVRELLGVRFVVGNHVTIDTGDGAYALCGHLQRGSVAVRPGQLVRAGDVIGRCGNSGNSSEPHVHVQVMDDRRPIRAAGLPVCLPVFVSPDRPTGVPHSEEPLDTEAAPPHRTQTAQRHAIGPALV